jgi:hypothetical protein
MLSSAILGVVFTVLGAVSDPVGDGYAAGLPGEPPEVNWPDLTSGNAWVDASHGELNFRFVFTRNVYLSDDFEHFEDAMNGYIDIDLNTPPGQKGISLKSDVSGYLSGLDVEAYLDLGMATDGTVEMYNRLGRWIADIPVECSGNVLTVRVPLSNLNAIMPIGDKIYYAAYFYSNLYDAADVFPNGERTEGYGYLVVPEPATMSLGVFLAGAGIIASRRARCRRDPRRSGSIQ